MKRGETGKSRCKILMLAAVFCMAVSFVSTAEEPTGALAQIEERGVLRVAIPSGDLIGFFETDEKGNLSGADIDLARDIAESMGVDVEFDRESDNHNALTQKLQNHEVDLVIATYSRTLERIRYVDFSEPYLAVNFGIMANRQLLLTKDAGSNPVAYLKKHPEKIAAAAGTSHVAMAKKLFPECTIVEAEDYARASEMVKNREVFAFFCGELEFYSQYLEDEELPLYTSVYTFSDVKDEFCVGVAKENADLLSYINLYLETSQPLTKDGIKQRLKESYQ